MSQGDGKYKDPRNNVTKGANSLVIIHADGKSAGEKKSAEQLVQNYRSNIAVELDNNQWKVSLLNIFQLILILVTMNRILNFIHIKVTTMNKMHVIHMRIWFIY